MGFLKDQKQTVTSICAPDRLEGGLVVIKYGRSTGRTVGRVQDQRLTLSLAIIQKIKGGVLANPGSVISVDEWLVIGSDKPFCEGGDSGSLVIDQEGALVGLLWGASFSPVSTHAIITDIHTVIASIKETAGLDMQIGT